MAHKHLIFYSMVSEDADDRASQPRSSLLMSQTNDILEKIRMFLHRAGLAYIFKYTPLRLNHMD